MVQLRLEDWMNHLADQEHADPVEVAVLTEQLEAQLATLSAGQPPPPAGLETVAQALDEAFQLLGQVVESLRAYLASGDRSCIRIAVQTYGEAQDQLLAVDSLIQQGFDYHSDFDSV